MVTRPPVEQGGQRGCVGGVGGSHVVWCTSSLANCARVARAFPFWSPPDLLLPGSTRPSPLSEAFLYTRGLATTVPLNSHSPSTAQNVAAVAFWPTALVGDNDHVVDRDDCVINHIPSSRVLSFILLSLFPRKEMGSRRKRRDDHCDESQYPRLVFLPSISFLLDRLTVPGKRITRVQSAF